MNTKTCDECEIAKELQCFEKNRHTCRKCREIRRANARKINTKGRNPSDVPKPTSCITCGKGENDGVIFKWRNDILKGSWRNVCNECFNKKAYYEKYRERKLLEDAEAFKTHNTAIHLAWAHAHPEAIKLQQVKTATSSHRKIKTLVTYARQKDIEVNMDEIDILEEKLLKSCYYCGFHPQDGEHLNGLDRIDSSKGYTNENTESCCSSCNAIKASHNIDIFISIVRSICEFNQINYEGDNLNRVRATSFGGRTELRNAPKKAKNDHLSIGIKTKLWCSPCYLCGKTPSFGIDRVDSMKDYTIDNSESCCSDCNYAKKDMDILVFKEHLGYINYYTRSWILRDIDNMPLKLAMNVERIPVGISNDGGDNLILVFPSISVAMSVFDCARFDITNAINKKAQYRNKFWRYVQPIEYRKQMQTYDECFNIIKAMRLNPI